MAADGSFALSAGQDRSLRLWARGEDLVFVEEERERAMEVEVDRAASGGHSGSAGGGAEGAVGSVEGDSAAASAASLPSVDSVRGGEMLMDALDLAQAEMALQAERTAAAR